MVPASASDSQHYHVELGPEFIDYLSALVPVGGTFTGQMTRWLAFDRWYAYVDGFYLQDALLPPKEFCNKSREET